MTLSPVFVYVSVFFIIINCNCAESCKKQTFRNTLIKFSSDEFGEFSKYENITGCVSSQYVSSRIMYLECYNQSLSILREGAITDMPELQTMIFMDNSINRIMWAAFTSLPKLEKLILSKNKIRMIDVGVFSVVPSVGLLELNNNELSFLGHGIFTNMPLLRILRLHHNQLDAVEHEWFDIDSNLSILDISHNLIRRIPRDAFKNIKNIEILDFSNNRILTVDENAFKGLDTLFNVDLSENRLYQLTGDLFAPLKQLDILHLHGNNLTYIHNKVLEGITSKLQEISIYSNPWQCACYENIMNWAHRKYNKLNIDISINCKLLLNPVCVVPENDPDECLEDIDEELDDEFYKQFSYDDKTCNLDFSHP